MSLYLHLLCDFILILYNIVNMNDITFVKFNQNFYFTEHRIHESACLVAYFKCIDLSILELNIATLHYMFSKIKNAVYYWLPHKFFEAHF
jgi:hypothetical protein